MWELEHGTLEEILTSFASSEN